MAIRRRRSIGYLLAVVPRSVISEVLDHQLHPMLLVRHSPVFDVSFGIVHPFDALFVSFAVDRSLRFPSFGVGFDQIDHRSGVNTSGDQLLGHSRHLQPTRTGNAVCQNVIGDNLDSPGGEAVVIESPDDVVAVTNTSRGATVSKFE